LNIVHFRDIHFEQCSINSEIAPTQTVISEIAFSFVDDAIALATGFGRITTELARDLSAAVRTRIMAPIDRLARACDVAGSLSARDQIKAKPHSTGRRGGRFDVLGVLAAFRTLRDLT
jgi:hypothetical protein